jgi:hypothetical protein
MNLPVGCQALVVEIARFTNLPCEVVRQRVWQEALGPSSNVLEDAARFRIARHVHADRLERP